MPFIAPIVEGHGEIEAVPILLHRIARQTPAAHALRVNQPLRVKSGSFLNDTQYFSRYIAIAAHKAATENGMVLVILDCDDSCPAEMGPDLLARAQAVRQDVRFLVALAHREFETWFIAAVRSLNGKCGLPNGLLPPPQAEGIRDAKGWLAERMRPPYDPVTHQYRFTRDIDLDQARANPSFNRLYSHIRRFLEA